MPLHLRINSKVSENSKCRPAAARWSCGYSSQGRMVGHIHSQFVSSIHDLSASRHMDVGLHWYLCPGSREYEWMIFRVTLSPIAPMQWQEACLLSKDL